MWGCDTCKPAKMWDWTRIYLFRTTDEYEDGKSNVKQICTKGHITRPIKKCTKCGEIYEIETNNCKICEVHVLKKTKLEVQIEHYQKEMNRLKSQLKKKKIAKDEYNNNIFALESKIRLTRISLLNLGQ